MADEKAVFLGCENDLCVDSLDSVTTGVLRIGTAASPYELGATANRRGVRFNFASSAVSATNVGVDACLWLKSGAGGQALHVYTFNRSDAPVDVVDGAHISLGFGNSIDDPVGTTGNITGLGCACRNTLKLPSRVIGGTVAAVMAEIWADGAASDVSHGSLFRAVVAGDATGIGHLDDSVYFMELAGGTTGAGNICHANAATDATHGLRCYINGASYDILMKANA